MPGAQKPITHELIISRLLLSSQISVRVSQRWSDRLPTYPGHACNKTDDRRASIHGQRNMTSTIYIYRNTTTIELSFNPVLIFSTIKGTAEVG